MRHFIENDVVVEALPEEYQEDFASVLSPKRVVGTLCDISQLQIPLPPLSNSSAISYWCMHSQHNLPKYSSRGIFTKVQAKTTLFRIDWNFRTGD
jgi:hypothetical protein